MVIMYTGPNYTKKIESGFYVKLVEDDNVLYSNTYEYGKNASFSKQYAKDAHENVKMAKKHNWNVYYNEKPFVIDVLSKFVKEYKVQQIICKEGEHVTNPNELLRFINDYIVSDKKLSKLANMSNASINVNFKKLYQLDLRTFTDEDFSNRVSFNVYFKRDDEDKDKFGYIRVSILPNLNKLIINLQISFEDYKYAAQSLYKNDYTESALHSQLDEYYDQVSQTFNDIQDGFKILLEFLDLYSHKLHLDIINYEDIKKLPECFK